MSLGSFAFGRGREKQAAGASFGVDVQQDFHQADRGALRIASIVEDKIGISQCKNWQAGQTIPACNRRLERIGIFLVAVIGDEQEVLALTKFPEIGILHPSIEAKRIKGAYPHLKRHPYFAPLWTSANAQQHFEVTFGVNISQQPEHPRPLVLFYALLFP